MPTLYQAPAEKPAKKPCTQPAHVPMSPLAAFAVNPADVRFETQEKDEEVVLFLRQHPIVNVPWIAITIALVLGPPVLFPLFLPRLPVPLPPAYLLVGTLAWYVGTAGFALFHFLHWFFNIYIVTNERIIDIDFQYLLFKRFSQAELGRIQDITYASGGIFATVFRYGNVYVQTAAEVPNIEFLAVPRPDEVVERIRSLTEDTAPTP